jgi:hypothetical protein
MAIQNTYRCLAVLFLSTVSASLACAGAPATTPEQLIQEMSAAAKAGDTNGFLSYLTDAARNAVNVSIASQASLRAAEESFQKALEDKFGKGNESIVTPQVDLKTSLMRVKSFELVSKTAGPLGIVYLRVSTSIQMPDGKTVVRQDTFAAGQEGGSWKLELNPARSINASPQETAVTRSMTALQSGEFKDRAAALSGLSQARLEEMINLRRAPGAVALPPTAAHPTGPILIPQVSTPQ